MITLAYTSFPRLRSLSIDAEAAPLSRLLENIRICLIMAGKFPGMETVDPIVAPQRFLQFLRKSAVQYLTLSPQDGFDTPTFLLGFPAPSTSPLLAFGLDGAFGTHKPENVLGLTRVLQEHNHSLLHVRLGHPTVWRYDGPDPMSSWLQQNMHNPNILSDLETLDIFMQELPSIPMLVEYIGRSASTLRSFVLVMYPYSGFTGLLFDHVVALIASLPSKQMSRLTLTVQTLCPRLLVALADGLPHLRALELSVTRVSSSDKDVLDDDADIIASGWDGHLKEIVCLSILV